MAKPTESVPSFGKVTQYRGVTFKSQCEARWAAFFDLLEVDWEYEPFGESTFPDFKYADNEYLEVKGGLGSLGSPEGEYTLHPQWDSHPDARKVREAVARFKRGEIVVGLSDGRVLGLRDDKNPMDPYSWEERIFGGSEYLWSRTLIMVTGNGKY